MSDIIVKLSGKHVATTRDVLDGLGTEVGKGSPWMFFARMQRRARRTTFASPLWRLGGAVIHIVGSIFSLPEQKAKTKAVAAAAAAAARSSTRASL